MKTYVASIGGNAVLAFRAEHDEKARAMTDDQEGGMRSDLKALVGADGKPLRDGKYCHSSARGDNSTTCRMGAVSEPSNQ